MLIQATRQTFLARAARWVRPALPRRGFLRPVVLAAALLGTALPAAAADLDTLNDRVDRLTRDLADLRNQFHSAQGGGQPLSAGQAGSFETRLAAFENELRKLTGMVEQVTYQQNRLSQRLDRMQADVECRLTTPEGGDPSAGQQASTGGSYAAPAPAPSTGAAGTPQGDVKTLGTVPQDQVASGAAPQPLVTQNGAAAVQPGDQQVASMLPGTTPQEQYDYAFGLLRKADYAGAEQALTAFIQQHPGDPLAANAKYWLGETYYVRGNYNEAARAFGVAYQDHPSGPKATDSLLKLGLSLSLLGRSGDACAVFGELENRFPDAAANILQRSRQERGRLGC